MLINDILYFVAQTVENDLKFFLQNNKRILRKLARATQQVNRVLHHLTDLARLLIAIDLLPRAISLVFHLAFALLQNMANVVLV